MTPVAQILARAAEEGWPTGMYDERVRPRAEPPAEPAAEEPAPDPEPDAGPWCRLTGDLGTPVWRSQE
ncbi:hypothetical protein Amir_1624 [Actinosynnema mirum DSM 43827]|uniref:Uncharacterized protein n=1 Tax=Actinosynnema mirum (strain ATCC 29888 / DSM 43827 / JCM 3225 / NBRC 14064 / NCIMB 13271 / NRRL B-12336 / IMRU 3971 / 101) TaxID=446462 RepID=C6WBK5_ACTMD|nr:hypothetical protein Amir_1624 [Actinosynnema mirum DSM 43827]